MPDSSTNAPMEQTPVGEPDALAGERPQGEYEVVARRYRPRKFEELVGQTGLAKALQNAILHHRVGHAYLFTGARGVGKTSTARIFSKALNCEQGPAIEPCGCCEICQGITAGSDVDVLEIDGASNRGIDEIRQLRSNVSVRPSRARFKIYIIDEVHMLTTAAFNALLKTLEEPPTHVKFIFCTTDPEKIPITVLSRCQRFDFAPVTTDDIAGKLRAILDVEQVEADEDAIRLVARRAAGSVRDSQSLLEQLMAFCSGRITLDEVHQLLGTVRGGRLVEWIRQLQSHDAAGALNSLDESIREGADVGQLGEQLLGALRDALALSVGCGPEQTLHIDPADAESLREFGRQVGIPNLLAMAQIVDQTLTRMRQSTEPRILLEIALVRICTLEDLTELSKLIEQLGNSVPPENSAPATAVTEGSKTAALKKKETGGDQPVAGEDVLGAAPSTSTGDAVGSTTDAASTPEPHETMAVSPGGRANVDELAADSPRAVSSESWSATAAVPTAPAPTASPRSAERDDAIDSSEQESASQRARSSGNLNRLDRSHAPSPSAGRAFGDELPPPGERNEDVAATSSPVDPNVRLQEAGREDDDPFEDESFHPSPSQLSDETRRVASEATSPDESTSPFANSLTPHQARQLWQQVVENVGDTTADFASDFCRVAISGPNCLVVTLNSPYNKEMCERPERRSRLEELLRELAGRPIRIDFEAVETRQAKPTAGPPQRVSMQQRIREVERHPFVQQAIEMLDAQVEEVQLPRPKPQS